jgi:Spondin_N
MLRKTRIGIISGAIWCVLVGAMGVAAAAKYEVTVTNLTRGQVFTPILVASHQEGVRLFELGQPASVELEVLAEGGDTGPLASSLRARADVLEVTDSGSPLPPGHSVTLAVRTTARFDHVSVAAMLVPTNDGFLAINGVEGPHGGQTLTLFSPAYDAGTEGNDERCAHIPGPPSICAGEGFNASRQGAEGFVHIHAGIHGIGDLVAADRDWRNPVAKVTIRRSE